MGLIALFTGSRRSKDKRMEASKERNGNMLRGTLAIGRTIRRMASEFSSTKMATSMRVFGKEIKDTVRELTGAMRTASSAESTQVIGLKIRNMEEVLSSIRMEIGMTATGLLACLKEKVE